MRANKSEKVDVLLLIAATNKVYLLEPRVSVGRAKHLASMMSGQGRFVLFWEPDSDYPEDWDFESGAFDLLCTDPDADGKVLVFHQGIDWRELSKRSMASAKIGLIAFPWPSFVPYPETWTIYSQETDEQGCPIPYTGPRDRAGVVDNQLRTSTAPNN